MCKDCRRVTPLPLSMDAVPSVHLMTSTISLLAFLIFYIYLYFPILHKVISAPLILLLRWQIKFNYLVPI